MINPGIEIQIIAILISISCALCGCFLLLRKMIMMADSITHTILLGIVLAFFVVHDLNSPILIIGAAIMGLITVWLTELVHKTRLISEDSSIGVVFPLLFSIAIILITRHAGHVHIDTDTVLLGELAFAPFDRLKVFGVDIGAKSIYIGLALLIINILVLSIFYKELKLSTFDPIFAVAIGFSPVLMHYILMSIVSLTTVGAFEAVGSILVIAFMAGPPAAAYLLTDNLKRMIFISVGFAAISAVIGYHLSMIFDVSIAGMIASTIGILFFICFIFAPQRGLLGMLIKRKRQLQDFYIDTFILHISNHEKSSQASIECGVKSISKHLRWSDKKLSYIIKALNNQNLIQLKDDTYILTPKGIERSKDLIGKYYSRSLRYKK